MGELKTMLRSEGGVTSNESRAARCHNKPGQNLERLTHAPEGETDVSQANMKLSSQSSGVLHKQLAASPCGLVLCY